MRSSVPERTVPTSSDLDAARLWLAQAHWERGRPAEARQLAGADPPGAPPTPERAWMAAHDALSLDLVAALFPDLDALRQGRRLAVWRQTVTLGDLPNGDRLGVVWPYLLHLAAGGAAPPPLDDAFLRRLHEEAQGRLPVDAPV